MGGTVDNYTPYGVRLYIVLVRRTCTAQRSRSHDHSATSSRRPWALLAVALATFMTYLDNNIVNVALPAIQRDLHLTTSGLEWIVSGYILVFAGLLLAGGRLADAFGRRRLFLIGLTVFTAASLAAGLRRLGRSPRSPPARSRGSARPWSRRPPWPSSARPTRGRASAPPPSASGPAWAALALAVGPLLGGVLAQHASWGWIFEINVPVGIATLLLGAWAITESREPVRRRLDVPGLVLSAVALTALTWALIEGAPRGWTSPLVLGSFAVAAARRRWRSSSSSSARRTRWSSVALFRDRVFSGGVVAMMLWAFGLFGIYFFTSLYLQDVLGFSPTEAGLAFLPMALCMVDRRGALRADRPRPRHGPRGRQRDAADGRRDRDGQPARRRRVLPRAHAELRASSGSAAA